MFVDFPSSNDMKASLRRLSSGNSGNIANDDVLGETIPVSVPIQVEGEEKYDQAQSGRRMTSFSADSPYFRNFVDREVEQLNVLRSTLLEIARNAREFEKCSVAMVEATHNLSTSCKLQSYSSSELAMVGGDREETSEWEARQKLFALKKECLGGDMFKVLSLLGEVLDGVADAQLQMCQSLHASLSDPLDAFVENDIAEVYRSKNDAYAATDSSEKALSQYIHGRTTDNISSSISSATTTRGSSTGGRVSAAFMDIKSGLKAGIKTARNGGVSSEVGGSTLQFTVNSLVHNLVDAELARFHVLRSLDTLKTRRDFELGESTLASLIGIKAYFHHCADLTQGLTPKYDAIQIEQSLIKKKLEDQHIPWETHRTSLNAIMDELRSSEVKVTKLDASCGKETHREDIEKTVGLWELPRRFEEFSVYQREARKSIIIEGWLYKHNPSRMAINVWNRRWFIVDNSGIYYMKRDENENSRVKICDIVLCSVKQNDFDCFCFEIATPNNKPLVLKAVGPYACELWIESIKKCIETNLGKSPDGHKGVVVCESPLQKPTWNPSGETSGHSDILNVHQNVENANLRSILENNRLCADCGRENPDWVSLNLCVLICIECSGIHRSLGVHLSKVRSMKMDDLSKYECLLLTATGNRVSNKIYEAHIPPGWVKPLPSSDRETKEKWIKSKYVWKGFISLDSQSHGVEDLSAKLYSAARNGDVIALMSAFIKGADVNWKNMNDEGRTALHACSLNKEKPGETWNGLECAEFLIQNGAKIDILDYEHRSPIDVALVEGAEIELLDYFTNRAKL